MALQEERSSTGWPFGLQPVNTRLRLETFRWEDPSVFITSSPSYSSSSGLETESTASFFGEKSVTLGRLIGFTYVHSLSSALRQSRNSYSTRVWLPHYKKKKKSRSWVKWFSNLMPCQIPKGNQSCCIDGRDNLPSLGQMLNLEELQGSSADNRCLVNLMYEDSVVSDVNGSALHESSTSLDSLGATSSEEQGVHEEGFQTKAGTAPLVEEKPISETDDKSHAKSGGCIICFRTSILE
ncbi:hypothetical protein O6H91_11G099700 [Diphasiastrum complanatum]|uniref:Uncharacterized protein n=1 Tax=Diphasiastrum complanatum TaxID=34168 RepID=A0ACC2CCZ5_DIPCM|nr:hypothetical protein O6H91_Y464600 [Diphasiastrum complanatum]KAJ7539552.1 hypothetical protein O6H91_11G099700 [Diphasiastrum complanatum]